jgi:hypothetical protein
MGGTASKAKKANGTTANDAVAVDSDSELSELGDSDVGSQDTADGINVGADGKKAKTEARISGPNGKKAVVAKVTLGEGKEGKAVRNKKGDGGSQASVFKAQGKTKDKGKNTADKNGEPKPRPKPKKIVVPVDPPIFEKVDTRLGREEAEQRMIVSRIINKAGQILMLGQLREFCTRFRSALNLPDRMLGPLDDFDRPLTESTARLIAGGLLDVVREELEKSGLEPDVGLYFMILHCHADRSQLIDTIVRYREEIRYYADLARFSVIINDLLKPLKLRLPPSIASQDRRANANNAAMRSLLDLEDDQVAPTWATESSGPSRRTAASRIPLPWEVVRMLLALADCALPMAKIRAEVDRTTLENEVKRKAASDLKKETTRWEAKSKKLGEARVRCKSAAETRANKDAVSVFLGNIDPVLMTRRRSSRNGNTA